MIARSSRFFMPKKKRNRIFMWRLRSESPARARSHSALSIMLAPETIHLVSTNPRVNNRNSERIQTIEKIRDYFLP